MKQFRTILFSVLTVVLAFSAAAQSCNPAKATCAVPAIVPDYLNKVEHNHELFYWKDLGSGKKALIYNWNKPAVIYSLSMEEGKHYLPGREAMILSIPGRSKGHVDFTIACQVLKISHGIVPAASIPPGAEVAVVADDSLHHDSVNETSGKGMGRLPSWAEMFTGLWQSTGISDVIRQSSADFGNTWSLGLGRVIMILVGILLLYLAVFKQFEPLLLLPIGFGAILANIPLAMISGPDGILGMVYHVGIATGVFPLIIFMGVGAMTDFGPLIANPKTALLGAAAQFGIFIALLGAVALTAFSANMVDIGIMFDLKDAASIGIIGGADGPTSIYLTSKLSPKLLGAIAVAAYSYMALVPIIQPPIMMLLTTKKDRQIRMTQLRHVSKLEKICFPVIITLLCALLLPDAAPLIGMLMFGNLMKESGVVDRLSTTAQNDLINIVTIFLGLAVGSKLSADQFLNMQTLGILVLGIIAFCVGTASGVIFGQIMKICTGGKVNPLIGAAGVSAVPMAARVVNKVGLEADPHNFLLMHAMGPNVAGVIGSAVAAGVLLKALSGF
ncbi:MAG: sodium ion-translocating decarboxylase subunit beta [Victivallales bacterium]|nr:sodium ion-translocating decarboxylase subunit beta [Victivallales bacterium]